MRCRDTKTPGGFGPNVGHDADITATHYAWIPSLFKYYRDYFRQVPKQKQGGLFLLPANKGKHTT